MLRKRGFTLLELVVAVLILGIIAAVAAPKLLVNTSDAADSAIAHTLSTLRDAIEMYRAQTMTGYPRGTSDEIHTKLDPYMRSSIFPPVNVGGIQNNNEVLVDSDDVPTVSASSSAGWVYSPSSGEVRINSNSELASQPGSGIRYSDL
jgi:prepilin-type N-terminal cleavage/methylation domain-containing protein